jgi:hypothetical protein
MRCNRLVTSAVIMLAVAGCGEPAKPKVLFSASSQSAEFGPQGLFETVPPGWHSAQPPKFPESITVDFLAPRDLHYLDLLQQDGHPARSPKAVRVEVSDDGNTWTPVGGADDACTPNTSDEWFNIDFGRAVVGRYMKLIIFSNCGDTQLVSLRGLRVD